jgi:hypothetical protein
LNIILQECFSTPTQFYNALIWWNGKIPSNRNISKLVCLADLQFNFTISYIFHKVVKINLGESPTYQKWIVDTFLFDAHKVNRTNLLFTESFQNLMQWVDTYVANISYIPLSSDDFWLQMPTYLIHQSVVQKMEVLKECSNISEWLIYNVLKKSRMVACQKSEIAIQMAFGLVLQPKHNTHKVLNCQNPTESNKNKTK